MSIDADVFGAGTLPPQLINMEEKTIFDIAGALSQVGPPPQLPTEGSGTLDAGGNVDLRGTKVPGAPPTQVPGIPPAPNAALANFAGGLLPQGQQGAPIAPPPSIPANFNVGPRAPLPGVPQVDLSALFGGFRNG